MTTTVEPEVKWSQDQMVEVLLNEPDAVSYTHLTLPTTPYV